MGFVSAEVSSLFCIVNTEARISLEVLYLESAGSVLLESLVDQDL